MTQLERIFAALHEKGPMTSRQLGALLDMTHGAVNFHIGHFRRFKTGIRISGFDMTSPTRKERIYAIGHEEDATLDPKHRPPSRLRKHPDESADEIAERHHKQRLQAIAAATRPFRDPMIWALFEGVAA